MDSDLLGIFRKAVEELQIHVSTDDIDDVHQFLVKKVYNARCNEFLRSISKLACIDNDKAIEGNVSLRDELKVYALNSHISD